MLSGLLKGMRGFVQILGTNTVDTTPSLLVFFDNRRYLFDVGEGTQRFCLEHKVKISRLDSIFLTRLSWEQLGGLPGMILTVSDLGNSSMKLWGPTGLLSFLTATRYFLQRPNFHMEVSEFNSPSPAPFQDDHLKATPILINPSLAPPPYVSSIFPPLPSSTFNENLLTIYHPSTRRPNTTNFPESTPQLILTKTATYAEDKEGEMEGEGGEGEKVRVREKSREGIKVDETEGDVVCAHAHTRAKRPLESEREEVSTQQGEGGNGGEGEKKVRKKRTILDETIDVTMTNGGSNQDHKYSYCSDAVVCYICQSPSIPGKFNPKKALALGIPAGPMYSKLQGGETVIAPETGQEVRPDQVIEPSTPGPIFAVIQCPSPSYVPYITRHPDFSPYKGPTQTPISFIIHMTSYDSLNTPEYKEWMHQFGTTTEHIIINKENCAHNFTFRSSTMNQYRMNHIEPSVFPRPHFTKEGKPLPDGMPAGTIVGQNLMQLHIAPVSKRGIVRNEVLPNLEDDYLGAVTELSPIPGFNNLFENYKEWKQCHGPPPGDPNPFLLFLGTGSAIPSKYRNVTGIYFEPSPKHGIMLDAGEGSYGQLFRRFGEKIDEVLTNIKLVWISHIHADHHLGLVRILAKRDELSIKEPLLVIGPKPVGKWLAEYAHVQPLNLEFVDCTEIVDPNHKYWGRLHDTFGFTSFFNIEVMHCADAYGVIITHKDGWKLVYSGDTKPCPNLEAAGADATLLIHEATLEEGMEQDAEEKGHSTTTQAVESGLRMRAKFILLTHFSQRYPKIPVQNWKEEKVGVAFDLMNVNWGNLPLLPKLLPPVNRYFEEDQGKKELVKEKNRKEIESNKQKLLEQKERSRKNKETHPKKENRVKNS